MIPNGKYVIQEPLLLSGANNLIIRGENPGDVIITSGMDVPIEKLTCLDEAAGLYEITIPELKMPPWPDSFRGYAGWPEIYIDGKPLSLSRYPNEGFLKADSVSVAGRKPNNEEAKQMPPEFFRLIFWKITVKNFLYF